MSGCHVLYLGSDISGCQGTAHDIEKQDDVEIPLDDERRRTQGVVLRRAAGPRPHFSSSTLPLSLREEAIRFLTSAFLNKVLVL